MSILRPILTPHTNYEGHQGHQPFSQPRSRAVCHCRQMHRLKHSVYSPIATVACRTTLSRLPARIKLPNEVVISASLAADTNNLISR